jgi:large subunit ribosomal protein L24
MARIRKGDNVIVTAGRDKGRKGAVLQVLGAGYLLVEGVNVAKKHQRPNPQKGQQGGILDKEMPLHVSKVAIFNPATSKGGRVGYKKLADGKKVRFFKSNGEVLDA